MFARSFFAAAVLVLGIGAAHAAPPKADRGFFREVQGSWSGSGEIVNGKYKGTKFACTLEGAESVGDAVMAIDGKCRVGVFSQPMQARISWDKNGYRGAFLDGQQGAGLDVVGGMVGKDRAIFNLVRKDLNGAMIASVTSKDSMTITISVKVGEEMVPVIGLGLKRSDPITTSSTR